MNPMLYARFLSGFSLALALCLIAACSKTDAPQGTSPDALKTPQTPTAQPATAGLGLPAKLCGVLRGMAPELKDMSAVGARAQLVMAIANTFNTDPAMLSTVSSDIDTISSASCPEVREPLLTATKAASLQEAVR